MPEAVEDTTETRERAEFDAFLDALSASEAAEMTPADIAEKPTRKGLQGGGVHISVVAPGTPQTLARALAGCVPDPRGSPWARRCREP